MQRLKAGTNTRFAPPLILKVVPLNTRFAPTHFSLKVVPLNLVFARRRLAWIFFCEYGHRGNNPGEYKIRPNLLGKDLPT